MLIISGLKNQGPDKVPFVISKCSQKAHELQLSSIGCMKGPISYFLIKTDLDHQS